MPAIGNLIHTFRTPSLPSVLVSRLLLDLQETYRRKVVVLASHSPLASTSSSPTPGDDYPRLTPPGLGALGATLDPGKLGSAGRRARGRRRSAKPPS